MNNVQEQLTYNQISFSKKELFRLKKLDEKSKNGLFEVAFCGHFSAGKSTILNKFLQANVLPTSPIPTSANIIKIKNGKLGLSVQSDLKEYKTWSGEIPWDKVREWGMNGNDVDGMTITAPLSFLGNHSCILDTPGVDSTDETHEKVTLEQLYTTDLIVYVMDYNHVQSETNLYFLKQLSLEKKPIYIIINQIDKHNEGEISIDQFKASIITMFKEWEIDYLKLFFTSMTSASHTLNKFSQFEKELKGILYNCKSILKESQLHIEKGFHSAVELRLSEEKQEATQHIYAEMHEKGLDKSKLKEQKVHQQHLQELNNYKQLLQSRFDDALKGLFKNVTLFPYTTTELTREWLESIQPGFKVGFLFTKKKTEDEQKRRLENLIQELQDKVKSQLLFHVQAFFQKVDRTQLSNREAFESAYNDLSYTVKEKLLQDHVTVGYKSREYVFQFTKTVTDVIVKAIRKKADQLLQLQIAGIEEFIQRERQIVKGKLERNKETESYVKRINEITTQYTKQIEIIREEINSFPNETNYFNQLLKAANKPFPNKKGHTWSNLLHEDKSVIDSAWSHEQEYQIDKKAEKEKEWGTWLQELKHILDESKDTSMLSYERESLLSRINRLENQSFIVSLFGAFSAGKSSFANALLGEALLPVSPNPTTATINIIEKASNEYPHGTIKVSVKTKQALEREVHAVSDQIGKPITLDALKQWKWKRDKYFTPWQKTYGEYLLTLKNSLERSNWELGSHFLTNQSELSSIIADENNACLVEKVNSYYDSPITKAGIILVDTPGVNSIHGRHTNVAFQQMHQSDAIFYLTYYNHAFSKADQYFLQQMGKVNESFQSDKLYFLINASDLATDKEELNVVRKHVYNEIFKCGIKNPRLFHLSSKEGLRNKQAELDKESSLTKFETYLYNQTIKDLKNLSLKLVKSETESYKEKLSDTISFINSEKEVQMEKRNHLQKLVKESIKQVEASSMTHVQRDVIQELDQLVLYLRERMRLVFNDIYSSLINVAVLTGDKKSVLQNQLAAAIQEWKGSGEYFLKQELEATSIRLEEKLKGLLSDWVTASVSELQGKLPHLYFENDIKVGRISLSWEELSFAFDPVQFSSYIKSKKDFFENGGSKQLKEDLVTIGIKASNELLHEVTNVLKQSVDSEVITLEKQVKSRLIEGIKDEGNRFQRIVSKDEIDSLKKEYERVHRL